MKIKKKRNKVRSFVSKVKNLKVIKYLCLFVASVKGSGIVDTFRFNSRLILFYVLVAFSSSFTQKYGTLDYCPFQNLHTGVYRRRFLVSLGLPEQELLVGSRGKIPWKCFLENPKNAGGIKLPACSSTLHSEKNWQPYTSSVRR